VIRFSVDLDLHNAAFFKRPRTLCWLNNKIRYDVSSYCNYFRIRWWKIDLTVQWGCGGPK